MNSIRWAMVVALGFSVGCGTYTGGSRTLAAQCPQVTGSHLCRQGALTARRSRAPEGGSLQRGEVSPASAAQPQR